MHYKNGRTAQDGDPVVFLGYRKGVRVPLAGTLHSTMPSCTSCNGQVAVPEFGGCQNQFVTIGEIYHAEDAFAAIDSALEKATEKAASEAESAKGD